MRARRWHQRGDALNQLQRCEGKPVVRLNAHAGVHREPAVPVAQHVFGLKALQQAPAHERAQDATTQGGLHLGHGGLIDCTGLVEDDARRGGFTIAIHTPRYFLKHPIDDAHMKMHMLVKAGAKAVNEGDSSDMQGCFVYMRRTSAMPLQEKATK
jgi:hypothetical protein